MTMVILLLAVGPSYTGSPVIVCSERPPQSYCRNRKADGHPLALFSICFDCPVGGWHAAKFSVMRPRSLWKRGIVASGVSGKNCLLSRHME